MTREEKQKILEEAEHRAYSQIQATPSEEMGEESFRNLLGSTDQLRWMIQCLSHPELLEEGDFAPESEPTAPVEEVPAQAEEASEPAPEPEPDPQPTYTKDQMVTKLTHYIDEQGVNVNAVMSAMGFAKLSQIPADRYQELLNKCEAAVEGNA